MNDFTKKIKQKWEDVKNSGNDVRNEADTAKNKITIEAEELRDKLKDDRNSDEEDM